MGNRGKSGANRGREVEEQGSHRCSSSQSTQSKSGRSVNFFTRSRRNVFLLLFKKTRFVHNERRFSETGETSRLPPSPTLLAGGRGFIPKNAFGCPTLECFVFFFKGGGFLLSLFQFLFPFSRFYFTLVMLL